MKRFRLGDLDPVTTFIPGTGAYVQNGQLNTFLVQVIVANPLQLWWSLLLLMEQLDLDGARIGNLLLPIP